MTRTFEAVVGGAVLLFAAGMLTRLTAERAREKPPPPGPFTGKLRVITPPTFERVGGVYQPSVPISPTKVWTTGEGFKKWLEEQQYIPWEETKFGP